MSRDLGFINEGIAIGAGTICGTEVAVWCVWMVTLEDVGSVATLLRKLVVSMSKPVRVAIMGSSRDLRAGVRFLVDGGLAGVLRVLIFGIILQYCMTN